MSGRGTGLPSQATSPVAVRMLSAPLDTASLVPEAVRRTTALARSASSRGEKGLVT